MMSFYQLRVKADLYNWKFKGGLDVVLMICDETKCDYTFGVHEPFTFKPESQEQRDKVIELLNEFEIRIID